MQGRTIRDNSSYEALLKSYQKITQLLKNQKNRKITFFVTGILAKKFPSLIKQISDDGHEIASHYFEHDLIYKQDLKTIENNINLSIESLYLACGKKPIGFRAPAFSIPQMRKDIFTVLSKYFRYDSSYVLEDTRNSLNQYNEVKNFFKDIGLIEFPIVCKSFVIKNIQVKSGGSYFRILNTNSLLKTMLKSNDFETTPIIYLHPYDLLYNYEFWVKYSNLKSKSFIKKNVDWLMQHKYLSIGNKNIEKKLDYIHSQFFSYGRIGDFLESI